MNSLATFSASDAPPAWQRYLASPYVADTLASLLGTVTPTIQTRAQPPMMRPDLTGLTSQRGDTVTMYGRPNDGYFTHEIGHVLDVHNIAPVVSSSVAMLFNPNNKQAGYAATNEREYVAEAFRTAMALVRQHGTADDIDTHVARADKRLPGTALWVKWIQQHLAARVAT